MKILVIGDAIIDHYIFGLVHRQSPEDPSIPVVDFITEEYKLGGSLNVAANIRSLAHKLKDEVYTSSIISRFTSGMLKKKQIFYDAICLDEEDKPAGGELIKTRIVHSETHKQFLRLDNRLAFADSDIQRYKNRCFYYNGKEFDAVVVSDYNKGVINNFVIDKLKELDCPIFIDTKKKDLSIWDDLRNCIIKLNRDEWSQCSQQTKHTVIVTQGGNGAHLRLVEDNTGWASFRTEPDIDADVVGAGDVFLAGLVVKYLETKDVEQAIVYANKAAVLSVKKFGTCEVRRDELL